MSGERPWTALDRTHGLLDDVLALVRLWFPSAVVTRLVGTHPSDDDDVFWVKVGSREVQIDTGDGGVPPFLLENEEEGSRLETSDPELAISHIRDLLRESD